MVIDRNSLKASYTKGGQTYTIYLTDYITSADIGFYKYWDADSGRNLAKKVVGSFDIFPKIVCNFKPLNQTELEAIAPLLNARTQSFTYYDPELKQSKTISTYTGDWSSTSRRPNLDEPFNVSFIAEARRV